MTATVADAELVTAVQFAEARERIRGAVLHTPLVRLPSVTDAVAYLKAESLQPIGSFKLRGAFNAVAQLSEAQRQRGVITYSSGNHGQGVAYAARALGVKAVIVMPGNAPSNKLESTAALGAEVVKVGPSSEERRIRAEELAARHGYAIVPPYNDEHIIAGQGTTGLEILDQLPGVETVLVPVGGGGLISGISVALKLSKPSVKIIGVEPELAADAQASLRAGHIVEFSAEQVTQTLADGLRTQSIGAINFEHIRTYVDDIITVKESEIEQALRALGGQAETIAEPSGATAVAGFLFHADELPRTKINVAVISGGNIDPQLLAEMRSK